MSCDGSTWETAHQHLQDALAQAIAGDQVWVAEGVYRPDESFASPSGTGNRSATFHLIQDGQVFGGFDGTKVLRWSKQVYFAIIFGGVLLLLAGGIL